MNYGGGEKSLLDILRNLNYEKYVVDLLLIEGKGEYFTNIPIQVNILYKDLTNSFGPLFQTVNRCIIRRDFLSLYARIVFILRKLIHPNLLVLLRNPLMRNNSYDFAIAFRPGICTDILQFTVNARKKTTWWHNGEINMSYEQLKRFEKSCSEFKSVVTVSDACGKMLTNALPSIKEYISIIPNMIDVEYVNKMAQEFSPNFKKKIKHFVTASRIAPEKHIENVIYASELLVINGFSNFEWHVLGDGNELERMKTLSHKKKVTNHVIFEGKKTNPFPYIKNADLYIHTSYVESQGLSILEAMALNTPCVITDNSGIRSYANKKNSVIVEQGFESLANAIIEIFQNGQEYENLKNSTRCPEMYYAKNIIKKIDHFLN